jgi:hypothetical protein
MNEFYVPEEEKTVVDYAGDDVIELTIPLKDSDLDDTATYADFPILFANSTGEFTIIGKSATERLATSPSNWMDYFEKKGNDNWHQYFVATYNTSTSSESYLLRAAVSEDKTNGRNETTITNLLTDEIVCEDKYAGQECSMGDVTFNIVNVTKNSTDEWVHITPGTNVNFNTIFSKGGLKVFLPFDMDAYGIATTSYGSINFSTSLNSTDRTPVGHDSDSFWIFFIEENKDEDVAAGNMFNITLNDDSDGDVFVSAVDTGRTNHEIPGTDDDTTSRAYSELGTKVNKIVASDKGRADIYYSGTQSYAEVFLTASTASTTGSSSVTIGEISVLDTELDGSGMSGKNLIVVGGTCVNSIAAELLSVAPATCGADWTTATGAGAGEWILESFESPYSTSKIALLVAGWEQGDTANAATYLTTQEDVVTDAGTKLKGSTATSATLVAE